MVGFPLIFETQPRPIPVDLPIDIPRKDTAPPLSVPTREPLSQPEPAVQPAQLAAVDAPAAPKAAEKAAVVKPVAQPVEKLADKAAEKTVTKAADKPAEKAASKPAEKVLEKPAVKPVDQSAEKFKVANDGARAQALLEGKEPAPAPAARYIVQVGAYGESKAAQEVRLKVEKLGLKTYAQAVDTADGHRVRVRLGPFASRDEAERAAAKLKGVGLPSSILTL